VSHDVSDTSLSRAKEKATGSVRMDQSEKKSEWTREAPEQPASPALKRSCSVQIRMER